MEAQIDQPKELRRPKNSDKSYPWQIRDAAIEALCDPKFGLTGNEIKVAMKVGFIMPYNGFTREYSSIIIGEVALSEILDMKPTNLRTHLRALALKNIISRAKGALGLNLDPNTWEMKTISHEMKTISHGDENHPMGRLSSSPTEMKTISNEMKTISMEGLEPCDNTVPAPDNSVYKPITINNPIGDSLSPSLGLGVAMLLAERSFPSRTPDKITYCLPKAIELISTKKSVANGGISLTCSDEEYVRLYVQPMIQDLNPNGWDETLWMSGMKAE